MIAHATADGKSLLCGAPMLHVQYGHIKRADIWEDQIDVNCPTCRQELDKRAMARKEKAS